MNTENVNLMYVNFNECGKSTKPLIHAWESRDSELLATLSAALAQCLAGT